MHAWRERGGEGETERGREGWKRRQRGRGVGKGRRKRGRGRRKGERADTVHLLTRPPPSQPLAHAPAQPHIDDNVSATQTRRISLQLLCSVVKAGGWDVDLTELECVLGLLIKRKHVNGKVETGREPAERASECAARACARARKSHLIGRRLWLLPACRAHETEAATRTSRTEWGRDVGLQASALWRPPSGESEGRGACCASVLGRAVCPGAHVSVRIW